MKDLQILFNCLICQHIVRHVLQSEISFSTRGFSCCTDNQNISTFWKKLFIIQCYLVFLYQPTDFSTLTLLSQMVSTKGKPGLAVPAVLQMLQDLFLPYPDIFTP